MAITKAGKAEEFYKRHDDMIKAKATEEVDTLLRLAKENLIRGEDFLLNRQTIASKVVGISDRDTVTVLDAGEKQKRYVSTA